jgi:hypothetical protein
MKDREEIIKSIIKNSKISRSELWVFSKINLHCELISKGVRNIAMVAIPSTEEQHHERYPKIKELVISWGLMVIDHSPFKGVFNYYIHSQGHTQDVHQIIKLFQEVRQKPKMNREQSYPLHREIGRLLGYSKDKIYEQYPET